MSQLQQFQFGLMDLRVLDLDGQPWFVAADVRRALGVAQSGSNYSFLSADEIQRLPRGLTSGKGLGAAQILSESGLYKFILRSDKPDARAFQDWVTRVVLPAIRKDGAYVLGEEKVATGEMDEDERDRLLEQKAALKQITEFRGLPACLQVNRPYIRVPLPRHTGNLLIPG